MLSTHHLPTRRRLLAPSLLLLLVAALVLPTAPAIRAQSRVGILFDGSFERGDLSGFYWHQNRPEVVSSDSHPVRAGKYSMRCYLHRYESQYSYRTEVIVGRDQNAPPDTQNEFLFDVGKEYWIGFSTYLPSNFVPDVDRMSDVVFQMQASPDSGEDYRSPVFALELNADTWRIFSRWDTRATSPSGNTFTGSEIVYSAKLGPSIGAWTDWVIHVKWSWQSNGVLQVWRNGQQVVNRTGPNCSNDREGPHPAIGVYKWPWKDSSNPSNTNTRLIYHDELRIGSASASYADVAPGGSGGAPAPTAAPTATKAPTKAPATPTVAPVPTKPVSPAVPGEVIVDDRDAGFSVVSAQEDWIVFPDATGPHYGGTHRYNRTVGSGLDVATWSFNVPAPGRYNVYAWWWASPNRPSDVPYTVTHQDGASTVRVNQQTGGGQWNLLGTYAFSGPGQVSVSDAASGGRNLAADAIRLVPVDAAPTAVPAPTQVPTSTPTNTARPTFTKTPPPPTATHTPLPAPTATNPAPAPTALPQPGQGEIIIDNADAAFATQAGQDAWVEWVQPGGQHYGASHVYNAATGSGQDVATWSFAVPQPGRYEVYAWWYASANRPSDVPYTVHHKDGASTVPVNQQAGGGQWNSLGVYPFEGKGRVSVSDAATNGRNLVADAVRLRFVEPLAPTPAPTAVPTSAPTTAPTAAPTAPPTVAPTTLPTEAPTATALPATPPPTPGDIVVDDTSDAFVTISGQDAWEPFSAPGAPHYGGTHRYNRTVGSGLDVATWSFNVPAPGRYNVYAWWWASPNRPSDVPYTVTHQDGASTVRVNQQTGGGQWNLLGTYAFSGPGQVSVSDAASGGRNLAADAVRIEYVGP